MKRQYSKLYKRGISLLTAATCICTLMVGCGQTEEPEQTMSEVIPVQVQQPEAGSLTIKNEFVGTISPEESVYVIPMVSAEVLSANVSVGDVVSAGDILCELDSEAAELQLASAQVQYESAEAGVNAAQVGYEMAQSQYEMAQSQYEIAQSQYESTAAQLDAQMGGQKNLQMYQLQIQVEEIHAGIDDIYKQIDDLAEDKKDAEDQKDDLKKIRNDANDYLKEAGSYLTQAQQAKTAIDNMTWNQQVAMFMEMYKEKYGEDYNMPIEPGDSQVSAAYEEVKKEAQSALDSAQSAYAQASTAASQASAAYEQAKAGIEAIEDGQEQLDGALEDAYRGLQQAEAIKNITEEQIYKDTQKVVDANKKTAALGVDSAALGVDSAALGIDSAAAGVNSAQIGVAGAQVAIDSAEYQLDMYTLKAPIDGVIEAVNVDEHAFATTGSPAFVISNKDTMMVTFYVSEGIRNTLTIGQKVGVDRNGKPFDAAITEIGSMVDQTTGLFAIKACVSAPDESLLTGCSVKITADTYSQDNVLLIPYDAVYYDDSQSYVYVVVGDTVERRNIETGIFDEQMITVLSGLTTDDQLITSWSANLREGALISIQATQDSAASGAADSEE